MSSSVLDQLTSQEKIKRRSVLDPLLLAIIGTAIILTGLILMMYLSWGSGQPLGDTPWYIPVMHSFAGLAAFSVAFLALGRYPVTRDAASYWIGMGFTAFGIQTVFFILTWPGLGSGGQGIIARLPNTSGWMAVFELSTLGIFLLLADLNRWPSKLNGKVFLPGRSWLWTVFAWFGAVILICIILVAFEASLPVLVDSIGKLTPLLLSLDWVFMLLFFVGAILSARQYYRTGDALLGYVALTQMALTFVVLTAFIGAKRYDIWYYLSRLILVGGFLALMFGLLSEYVRLYRRERESQEALQAYAKQLERANRDLQNFTVVASHDLQEPLRKIEAFGDAVLEDSSNLNERQHERIVRMRKGAQQMRSMVDGLLQVSLLSTEIQPVQEVDLYQTTKLVLSELDKQIKQRDGIVEISSLPMVEADPLQMQRLLQHLIENALKFQPPDGKPHVKVYSTQPSPTLVQITVEDNGIGFDEANAEHLFEPFERLVRKNQSEYDGIGIGLAICRSIVERHGGEIRVYSQPGQGTTFIITLPIHQPGHLTNRTRTDLNYAE